MNKDLQLTMEENDNANINEGNNVIKDVNIIYDKLRQRKLLEAAWTDVQNQLYTDVTVIVGKRKFQAHRLVLSSLSDYFPPLLKLDEKGSGEVVIQNVSSEDFEILLKYAYTGEVEITLDNIQSVIIAADYFSIPFVKQECIKFMHSNIDVDNLCDVLFFAIDFQFRDLELKAKQFMHENFDLVSKTTSFSRIDPLYLATMLDDDNLVLYHDKVVLRSKDREKLVLEVVLRYLNARREQDPQVTQKLLSTVRLPELSEDSITTSLDDYKELKNNEQIKNILSLRKEALQILSKKEQPHFSSLVTLAKEIPKSWFNHRKLAFFTITQGNRRYASGGEIAGASNLPHPLINDADFKIKRIEIYVRNWEDAEVIGGMKLVYQEMHGQLSMKEYFKGMTQNPIRNHVIDLEPNEYIVKVVIGSGWLIDSICFETNLGRVCGPYGGTGGSKHEEVAPICQSSYLFDINFDSIRTQGSPALYNLLLRWITFG